MRFNLKPFIPFGKLSTTELGKQPNDTKVNWTQHSRHWKLNYSTDSLQGEFPQNALYTSSAEKDAVGEDAILFALTYIPNVLLHQLSDISRDTTNT